MCEQTGNKLIDEEKLLKEKARQSLMKNKPPTSHLTMRAEYCQALCQKMTWSNRRRNKMSNNKRSMGSESLNFSDH
jgi:hypothetical protein